MSVRAGREMPYDRSSLPRRRPGGTLEPPEGERAEAPAPPPAPAPAGHVPALTPAQLLALQRAGVGNRLLAREVNGVEEDEEEGQEEVGGMPLLLTDRPWSEIVSPGRPLPPPEFDLELPIVIPLEHIPVSLLPLFGIAPTPLLLLEYKPLIPEPPQERPELQEDEPPADAEPQAETPAEGEGAQKKRRKRKKKGAGSAEPKEETKPAEPSPKLAAKPEPKPLHALSVDEMAAEIMGTQAGGAKKKKPSAAAQPAQKKKSQAQKRAEKELRARKEREQKEQAEADRKYKAQKQKEEKEAQEKEAAARVTLRNVLGTIRTTLAGERDNLPNGTVYDAIWQEADDGVTDLDAYLADKGPAETASSAQLKAKADAMNVLIKKVQNFKPPETPAQRRQRLFEQVKTNVSLAFGREQWTGPKGGQTDFTVDKNDAQMRALIVNYYGRDQYEIDGHASRDYPGKTKTSKVYYYVTGTSNTAGIAYDISLHAWDGNTRIGTVHVLHIPHKPN